MPADRVTEVAPAPATLFPDGCSCGSYGRGLTMTRVTSDACEIHGNAAPDPPVAVPEWPCPNEEVHDPHEWPSGTRRMYCKGVLPVAVPGPASVSPADTIRRTRILEMIDVEFGRAINKFGSFNSGHEGKAVIEEELEELWGEVRANRPGSAAATGEAIQIAAMAMRYVFDLSEWPDYTEIER